MSCISPYKDSSLFAASDNSRAARGIRAANSWCDTTPISPDTISSPWAPNLKSTSSSFTPVHGFREIAIVASSSCEKRSSGNRFPLVREYNCSYCSAMVLRAAKSRPASSGTRSFSIARRSIFRYNPGSCEKTTVPKFSRNLR